MDLIAYMETARNELVRNQLECVQSSLKRLTYLLDVHIFSPGDIELNQTTLTWPSKLSPVFEENEQIVESSKVKGEKELHDKQEKVLIEIEKCHRRTEELSEYSDLSLVQQYCKEIARYTRTSCIYMYTVAIHVHADMLSLFVCHHSLTPVFRSGYWRFLIRSLRSTKKRSCSNGLQPHILRLMSSTLSLNHTRGCSLLSSSGKRLRKNLWMELSLNLMLKRHKQRSVFSIVCM